MRTCGCCCKRNSSPLASGFGLRPWRICLTPDARCLTPDAALGTDLAIAEHVMPEPEHPKRRWFLGILSIFVLFFLYRVFTVYTVRNGDCRPKPVDPSLRLLTRDERGSLVSFPERINYPQQERPLVVMVLFQFAKGVGQLEMHIFFSDMK